MNLEELEKEELIKMIKMFAKNWLAHDGSWFLSIEEDKGLETAMKYDKKSWEKFTQIEAKRIMREFNIPKNSGLEGLEKALQLRMYAQLNEDVIEKPEPNKLIYKMKTCRVQAARERAGRPLFPCKEVGIIEYSGFAKTIDSRIKTRCIAAPPDKMPRDFYCGWEFTLEED